MSPIRQLIEELRARSDVGVAEEAQGWRICISKGRAFSCEVIIPHDVLEWFASVKDRIEHKDVWSDWMDYSGYDSRPREELEAEMARDILAFVDRVSKNKLELPLKIYQ